MGTTTARAVLILALLAGCGTNEAATPAEQWIELRSDAALLLNLTPQTAAAEAVVVDEDGREVEGARVVWSSSNPSFAEVTEDGAITTSGALGSALLMGRFEDLEPVLVSVVGAELAEHTHVVPTIDVIERSEDRRRVRLQRTSNTEAIDVGDVVVNGGSMGFLSRVDSIDLQANGLVLSTQDATIVDAVIELDLSFEAPVAVFEDEIEHADEARADGEVAGARSPLRRVPLKCDGGRITVGNIGFTGVGLSPTVRMRPVVDYRVRAGELEHFGIRFGGELQLSATIGELKMRGGLTGKVECKAELPSLPFLPIPLVGPLTLIGTATPHVGVELKGIISIGEVTIPGVVVVKGVQTTMGAAWDRQAGWSSSQEHRVTADAVRLVRPTVSTQASFNAQVEAFAGVDLGFGLAIGPEVLGRADIATVKILAGAEMSIATPLFIEESGYTGPRWALYIGSEANLDPLLEGLLSTSELLENLGSRGRLPGLGIETKLYEFRHDLLASPQPQVTAPQAVELGHAAQFEVTGADPGSEVVVRTYRPPVSESFPVAETVVDGSGVAQAQWSPARSDLGEHNVTAHVYDDIFGLVGLPYATTAHPTLTVVPRGLPMPDLGTDGDPNHWTHTIQGEGTTAGGHSTRGTTVEEFHRDELGWTHTKTTDSEDVMPWGSGTLTTILHAVHRVTWDSRTETRTVQNEGYRTIIRPPDDPLGPTDTFVTEPTETSVPCSVHSCRYVAPPGGLRREPWCLGQPSGAYVIWAHDGGTYRRDTSSSGSTGSVTMTCTGCLGGSPTGCSCDESGFIDCGGS